MVTEARLRAVGDIRRDHIDDFKVRLAARPRTGGQVITAETHRQRMWTVRPLPKFLDDRDAAKLMADARASAGPRDRLVMELLARTGMRAGELAGLEADAVVQIGAGRGPRPPHAARSPPTAHTSCRTGRR